jgi:hypothetical protein
MPCSFSVMSIIVVCAVDEHPSDDDDALSKVLASVL